MWSFSLGPLYVQPVRQSVIDRLVDRLLNNGPTQRRQSP
jgi:hypothetical protein